MYAQLACFGTIKKAVSEKRENSRIWLMAKDNSKENWKTPKMIQKAVKVPRLQTDGLEAYPGEASPPFPVFLMFPPGHRAMIRAKETFDMMQ